MSIKDYKLKQDNIRLNSYFRFCFMSECMRQNKSASTVLRNLIKWTSMQKKSRIETEEKDE